MSDDPQAAELQASAQVHPQADTAAAPKTDPAATADSTPSARPAPPRPGMSPEQAAETGHAMLASARAQRDHIADGFLARRKEVLHEVASQQAAAAPALDAPPQAELPGATHGAAAKLTQAEIEAALRAMGVSPAGYGKPRQAASAPQGTAAQDLVMREIALTIRRMITEEVRAQLASLTSQGAERPGRTGPAGKPGENGSDDAAFYRHRNSPETSIE